MTQKHLFNILLSSFKSYKYSWQCNDCVKNIINLVYFACIQSTQDSGLCYSGYSTLWNKHHQYKRTTIFATLYCTLWERNTYCKCTYKVQYVIYRYVSVLGTKISILWEPRPVVVQRISLWIFEKIRNALVGYSWDREKRIHEKN